MSDNGRFHDARHYTDVDVKKPDFFMTEKLIKQAKKMRIERVRNRSRTAR